MLRRSLLANMTYRLLAAVFFVTLTPAVQAQDPFALVSPSPGNMGHFGGAVAGLADVDRDNRGDLLVGADGEGGQTGRVHLFSGATGALIRTLQSPTPSSGGRFGIDVSGVPDLDDDGFSDILVGTSEEGSAASGFGRVHVFSGAVDSMLYSLQSPNPEGVGEVFPSFGGSVAGVADMDGDGYGDILVGARAEGTSDAGRAYLFSGAERQLLETYSSPNPEVNGHFGSRVDSVPDGDGDGISEIVVAAPNEDAGAVDAGRVYLFDGANGSLRRTLESPHPTVSGTFGSDVAGVSDMSGDGRGDVLVGAGGDLTSGRAYLFDGDTGAVVYTLVSPNPVAGGRFGDTVAAVEDIDGDDHKRYRSRCSRRVCWRRVDRSGLRVLRRIRRPPEKPDQFEPEG